MSEFENRMIEGIYMSRFVASWINEGGNFKRKFVDGQIIVPFKEWLKTLTINDRKLTDEEIYDIYNFATNGKLELEVLAANFMAKQK